MDGQRYGWRSRPQFSDRTRLQRFPVRWFSWIKCHFDQILIRFSIWLCISQFDEWSETHRMQIADPKLAIENAIAVIRSRMGSIGGWRWHSGNIRSQFSWWYLKFQLENSTWKKLGELEEIDCIFGEPDIQNYYPVQNELKKLEKEIMVSILCSKNGWNSLVPGRILLISNQVCHVTFQVEDELTVFSWKFVNLNSLYFDVYVLTWNKIWRGKLI